MAKKYRSNKSSDKDYVKKSGAKLHTHLDNEAGLFIGAWKIIEGVMANIKIFVSEAQRKKGVKKSKTGKNWIGCTMVVSRVGFNDVIVNGMYNADNYKAYFKSWNWVCNPKVKNGGYIGKHISN